MVMYERAGKAVKPREMTQFWLRRLCEAALLISLTVITLYAWARFIPTGYALPIGLSITDTTTGIAAFVSLSSLILCFWLPTKHTSLIGTVVYLAIVAIIASLILTANDLTLSPLASAWLGVALFAGFFGFVVVGLMAAIIILYIVLCALSQDANWQAVTTNVIFGMLPIVLSVILWHRQPHKGRDQYSELANKLSTVEGKSDIVINSIDDGVLAINKEGVIDLINPSAQRMIGWTQGDALGLDWRSVIKLVDASGRDVDPAATPIGQALTTHKPTHDDTLSILTSSGKKVLISLVSSPVDSSGEGIIVVFRDITKEKAEEREQAEFISTASHEMRTPVASIEGYLGLALNPATANIDEKARDFITKAHASAQHLGRLFQDLLDISKAEDGRLQNNPQPLDVTATTREILEGLQHLGDEKQLQVTFAPASTAQDAERRLDPVFYADVDPSHFREVVSNLIENAIKYTLQGSVAVDVVGDQKLVTVSVKDSGIGIPAEDIPHLFQKFYRVDNSDTREIGGTGLGLYLCRRLAETMGGTLRVESEYQKGSTFFLDLPRMESAAAQQKLAELAQQPTASPVVAPAPEEVPAPDIALAPPDMVPTPDIAPTPDVASVPPALVSAAPEQSPTPPASPPPETPPYSTMTLADVEAAVAAAPQFAEPATPAPTAEQGSLAAPAQSTHIPVSYVAPATERPDSLTVPPRQ